MISESVIEGNVIYRAKSIKCHFKKCLVETKVLYAMELYAMYKRSVGKIMLNMHYYNIIFIIIR